MICESHFPTVDEDELTDNQEYKGLMGGHDLGYKGDLGGSFIDEGNQTAEGMTRTGDACHRVNKVKKNLFLFLHENDRAGDIVLDDGKWKKGIGQIYISGTDVRHWTGRISDASGEEGLFSGGET